MEKAKKYEASCHCGAVRIILPNWPEYMNECNCSLCSKSGGVWGYYRPSDVKVFGAAKSYVRGDLSNPAVQIHFCGSCGSTTHWLLTKEHKLLSGADGRMGVNMRLFDSGQLAGVELRFPDGKAWTGEGEFSYRRDAIIFGADSVL